MSMGIIIPIAAFALLLRYLIDTDAAKRTKYVVGGITGASFIVPFGYLPYGGYAAMALQLALSIFILFYLRIVTVDEELAGR